MKMDGDRFGLSEEVIREINEVFKLFPNIEEVVIFGSRAKGNFRHGSDIDLAAKGKGITFDELVDILLKIEDLGLLYKVDILSYNEKIGTPIGDHIDRVSQVFYRKEIERTDNV